MRRLNRLLRSQTGGIAPAFWGLGPSRTVFAAAIALAAIGCGKKEEKRTLDPVQLGMTKDLPAIYDDGKMQLFQVGLPVPFPVRQPTAEEQQSVNGQPAPPYPHMPFLLLSDSRVQITWTLTNLDEETHNVEVLVDPWNEFARYYPGFTVTNVQREEEQPNFSGIQIMYELPGTKGDRPSRKHGTFTYEDMRELAIDFGTVMNVIANAGPIDPSTEDNPVAGLINHFFNVQNRSYNDPLAAPYIPNVIPGLTGIDLGLRTYESANVAIEIVVEITDTGSRRVITDRDNGDPIMPEPLETISAGL